MSVPRFHELHVVDLRRLTDDAVALRFGVPAELRRVFMHLPGQYVTLRADVDEHDLRRSYSICSAVSAAGPEAFEVGIKRVAGGAFSTYAQRLTIGDTVAVMTPQGRFTAAPGQVRDALLVAAGSGITPCLSIASTLLGRDPHARVTLVYGNSRTADIMFRADLDALKDRHLERFVLVHALSREPQTVAFLNGRVSAALLDGLATRALVDPGAADGTWLCGPRAMTDEIAAWLVARGVAPERVHREYFAAPDASAGAVAGTPAGPVHGGNPDPRGGTPVDIVVDGGRRRIRVDAANETVLVAAQRQGLDLPYSCAGGMCCTCRCRIVEGAARMDANYSLQAWETEAGFTLACQARPVGDTLTLDFDAA